MRGLPFPSEAREPSYEYGTPFSPGAVPDGDAIPIDPALNNGAVIDPALVGEIVPVEAVALSSRYTPPKHSAHNQGPRDYAQGPQGDPFAPPPLPAHLPLATDEEGIAITATPVTPKYVRRRRKIVRELECGFCEGTDEKNKHGEPEAMVSCCECGRSGHPSCMDLSSVSDVIRSYQWKCLECKACEICSEKGDDSRILFCDNCDRGWHMDCLQPPLESSPPGQWYCPMCIEADARPSMEMEEEPSLYGQNGSHPVASSSRHPGPSTSRAKMNGGHDSKGKSKGKSIAKPPAGDSEIDGPVDVDSPQDEHTGPPVQKRGRGRPRKSLVIQPPDVVSPRPASPVRQTRMRLRLPTPPPPHEPTPPPPPRRIVRLKLTAGKGKERAHDDGEDQKGMFDDVLGPAERDVSKTTVDNADKLRFERARFNAELKLVPAPPPPPPTFPHTISDTFDVPLAGPSTRPTRSSVLLHSAPLAETPARSESPATPTHPSTAPGLRIQTIRFGQFDIKTWYDAPFPEEYANIPDGRLWICEFCLKYMKSRFGNMRHRMKCKARHPPGDEIYRDGAVSIFEVDGRKNKIYCQNLCLLSKMFLDHKSLFYDVEPFLFYVITEVDDIGARFVGYFSKEKLSPKDYNVSCIMTLPVRQRQGWGNLLIDFSYLLSKKEQRSGSPEKPLSGLGALGYKNYWTLAVMRYLQHAPHNPRLEDIRTATSMTLEDIHFTLTNLGFFIPRSSSPPGPEPSPGTAAAALKLLRGRKNGVARRALQRTVTGSDLGSPAPTAPVPIPRQYIIRWDAAQVDEYMRKWEAKGYLRLKPEKLKWSPFLLSRSQQRVAAEDKAKEQQAVAEALFAASQDADIESYADADADVDVDGDVEMEDGDEEDAPQPRRSGRPRSSGSSSPRKTRMRSTLPRRSTRTKDEPPGRRANDTSPRKLLSKDTPPPKLRAKDTPPRRTRAQDVSPPSTPVSARRRMRSGGLSMDVDVDADEALAAQLAREEEALSPRRTLRSRRGLDSAPVHVLTPTPSPKEKAKSKSKSLSPRKRRRIESSPEPEEDLPAAAADSVPEPTPEAPPSEDPASPASRQGNGTANGCSAMSVSSSPELKKRVLRSGNSVVQPLASDSLANDAVATVDVKAEQEATPALDGSPSDATTAVAGALEGVKTVPAVAEDEEDLDADAEGEDEDEDAVGEPDSDYEVEAVF